MPGKVCCGVPEHPPASFSVAAGSQKLLAQGTSTGLVVPQGTVAATLSSSCLANRLLRVGSKSPKSAKTEPQHVKVKQTDRSIEAEAESPRPSLRRHSAKEPKSRRVIIGTVSKLCLSCLRQATQHLGSWAQQGPGRRTAKRKESPCPRPCDAKRFESPHAPGSRAPPANPQRRGEKDRREGRSGATRR